MLCISQEGKANLTFLQECIPTKTIKQIKAKMATLNLSFDQERARPVALKTTTIEKVLSSPAKKF